MWPGKVEGTVNWFMMNWNEVREVRIAEWKGRHETMKGAHGGCEQFLEPSQQNVFSSWTWSPSPQPVLLLLLLSFHKRLCIPKYQVTVSPHTNIFVFLIALVSATFPAHLIHHNFTTLVMYGKEYMLWSSLLRNFLRSDIRCFLFGPHILHHIFFFQNLKNSISVQEIQRKKITSVKYIPFKETLYRSMWKQLRTNRKVKEILLFSLHQLFFNIIYIILRNVIPVVRVKLIYVESSQ